ncbi:MAG: BON domain-containing protein [Rickettsiales bacterium]
MKIIHYIFILCIFLSSCASNDKQGTIKYSVKAEKTTGEYIDDFLIKERIYSKIKSKMPKTAPYVSIVVVKGCVKYIGTITNKNEMLKLIEIAWSQQGVKEVVNYLEIENKHFTFDISQYAQDSWITSAIKIKTLTNKNIKFNNFTVITNNNIVYIFGIARDKTEMELIAKIASQVKDVEKVIVNVQLAN